MHNILVSGLINLETTARIDSFPLPYFPVRYPFFGVNSSISGVGYNVAKALTTLGSNVEFLSLIGRDLIGQMVQARLTTDGLDGQYVLQNLDQTPQSVILYDSSGQRQIHVDLKDIQDCTYPEATFDRALAACDTAILCNINFSRPFLAKAKAAGKLIVTDVHAISDVDDPYNRDFMTHADILFMSHEALPCSPEEWAWSVQARYGTPILIVSLGAEGALLATRLEGFFGRVPAVQTRPIVSTIGAGDALLASFVHCYRKSRDAFRSLQKAVTFASHKIGTTGAAEGFLDSEALERLFAQVQPYVV